MLDFLKPMKKVCCFHCKIEGFKAIVENWDFSQLAQVVNGQTFFKVFLPSFSLKAESPQVIADSKMD